MTDTGGQSGADEQQSELERLVAELDRDSPEIRIVDPAPDFISYYADYADVLEAPRILHEIVGIQLVAAILNRKGVTIRLGAVTHSLDLWTLLLSGSGAGRSTAVGLAAPILKASQMKDLQSPVRWGSGAAFYQQFAETPYGLHVWGEAAERLKMLNDPQFTTVKEWLTDRYDNFEVPHRFRYRRTGKSSDTPEIEFTQAPRINILATSSEDWFFRNLAEEDSGGGFLARWIIMRTEGTERDIPIPRHVDPSLVPPLCACLMRIVQLGGEADLSAIEPRYVSWYGETKHRFLAQPNQALAMAYFNRHRGHILKLAVIFEASQSADLEVSVAAWERAVKVAEQVERCIFRMLPTGMNKEGSEVEKMAERIRSAGPKGILKSELTSTFKHWRKQERMSRLSTLVESKTAYMFTRETTGRRAIVFVHKDHLDEHAIQHPGDLAVL